MKTQMRVQKILMLVSLVVSALVLVYALIFMTGGLARVYRFIDTRDGTDYINCREFVSTSQSFVSTLVTLSIIMIVLVAVMYLMACNSRRKYYVTNYIAIGLFVLFALAVAIYLVVMVATVMNLYQNGIRWNSGEGTAVQRIIEYAPGQFRYENVPTNYADQAVYYPDYTLDPNQTYNFVLGFIMFAIVFVDVVCVALCTVWKVLLMRGEKKLLAGGAPATETAEKEIAPAAEIAAEEVVPEKAQSAETVGEVASGDNPVKEEE